MKPLKCKRCNQRSKPTLTKSGPHIKASCGKCGKYIKFVSARQAGPAFDPNPVYYPTVAEEVRILNPGDDGYKSPPTYKRKIKRA